MPMDIPIIFSGPMVRALLDGRKTMTRRLATSPLRRVEVGDRLYVRESHWQYGRWVGRKKAGKVSYSLKALNTPDDMPPLVYVDQMQQRSVGGVEATPERGKFADPEPGWHMRPSIFMPRDASRITLIVTGKKVEPLHKITRADVLAEGTPPEWIKRHEEFFDKRDAPGLAFAQIWNGVHGKGAWDANPEVVAISFKVVEENIDRIAA